MFGGKNPNYTKLRTNLRLCINRLKLLEKKKAELALKSRKEIADYISAAKDDRARIRVEHIIREDYLVEAMEIVEMLCDLILARFGLIERMKEMDPGLEESIATIIWVTPRLCSDVAELREVTNQLTLKYGKEFAEMCRRNQLENVHEKVIHKLSLAAPPKILVESYMIEIAKVFKVPFEPDMGVMCEDSIPAVDDLISLENEMKRPPNDGPGYGGSSGGSGYGGGGSGFGGGGGGGGGGNFMLPAVPNAGAMPPPGVVYDSLEPGKPVQPCMPPGPPGQMPGQAPVFTMPDAGLSPGAPVTPGIRSAGSSPGAPPLPSRPPNASQNNSPIAPGNSPGAYENVNISPPHINVNGNSPLPNYDDVMNSPTQYPQAGPGFPASNSNPVPAPRTSPSGRLTPTPAPRGASPARSASPGIPQLPDIPGLPSVPAGSVSSTTGGDDVDFDDLTKRFEELKRRK